MKEIRPLHCEVNLLPRVHGSALFQRGETQALITITLGSVGDEQKVDGLGEEYSKKFMLDYNFPPYSVGESRAPRGGPGRREIGHGMLAERSLKSGHPAADEVPLHDSTYLRHHGIEWFLEYGERLRRHPSANGCRCTDQRSRCGHLDRTREGIRQVHPLHRHSGR